MVAFALTLLGTLLLRPAASLSTLKLGWVAIAVVAASSWLAWVYKRPLGLPAHYRTSAPLCLAYAGIAIVAPLSILALVLSKSHELNDFGFYAGVGTIFTSLSTLMLIGLGVKRIA